MRLLGLLLTLALQAVPGIDIGTVGPKLGDTVPDFELRDQHGASRSLSSLAGRKGTMLVFYRSADW